MKNLKLDVLGLGTCNADFLMNVSRFSGTDDEVDIEKLRVSLGGSAANFVVRVSRRGLNSGIIARIGRIILESISLPNLKRKKLTQKG